MKSEIMKSVLGVSAVLAFSQPALAETANAAADIRVPLQLANEAGLDFGEVLIGPGANPWIAMDLFSGNRFCANDTVCVGGFGTPASFTISGSGSANVTYPRTIDFTGPAGPDMYIDLQCGLASTNTLLTPEGQTISLVPATDAIVCGGTWHANPGQPDGNYTGTFTLTVDYN